jgi:hypothetical protein
MLNNVRLCRYITLEVKNILLESVSHHILPQMLNSPFLQHATDLVKDYLKFMDDHLKESADLTCLAYRHRTYSKVQSAIVTGCMESLPKILIHQRKNNLSYAWFI